MNRDGTALDRQAPPGDVDLVDLSLSLMGAFPVRDLLRKALRSLEKGNSRRRWAIVDRRRAGQYRVTASPGADDAGLRRILRKAWGARAEARPRGGGARADTASAPVWSAVPRAGSSSARKPDVLVACWGAPAVEPEAVERAAQLIASARRSARLLQSLLEQTSKDPLTGVLNRRGLLEVLERETARASRHGAPLSLLFADLDDFKTVNDLHGHAVGDEVLCGVAGLMRASLRASDTVGRIGGDEFVIVLPQTHLAAARALAARLRRQLRRAKLPTAAGELTAGVTIGVASLDESRGNQTLVERADSRMLANKRRKRSRAVERNRSREPVLPGVADAVAQRATGR